MTKVRDIVDAHIDTMMKEVTEAGQSPDAAARILFEHVLRIWRETRTPDDIASELTYAADNIDPDEDYMFMRP